MLAAIPLTPTYILAAIVYGETPAEVNINILSYFGLDDEYRVALRNPDFVAGQRGGNAGVAYVSLATFLKGLPRIGFTSANVYSTTQSNGLFARRLVLSLPGIEVVGGSKELVYIGTAGFFAINGSQGPLPSFGDYIPDEGEQIHHLVTNKGEYWPSVMRKITDKYKLDLDGSWNKVSLPGHSGRHTDRYHQWIYKQLLEIDNIAQGDTRKFLELFKEYVTNPVINNPGLPYR